MNTKKHKKIILGIATLALLINFNFVEASTPLLNAWSTSMDREVGDTFDIFVNINPVGEKVCVVEGTINLSNLSCQKITVSDGIQSRIYPSCEDLSFSLGIKGCSTESKTLFTVNVKADSAGSNPVNFSNVDILGAGVSLPFISIDAEFAISSSAYCDCGSWSSWMDEGCNGGDCLSSQQLQASSRNCTPSNCDTELITRCVSDLNCKASDTSITNNWEDSENSSSSTEDNQANNEKNNFLANLVEAWGETTKESIIMITVFSAIILSMIFGIRRWGKIKRNNKKY